MRNGVVIAVVLGGFLSGCGNSGSPSEEPTPVGNAVYADFNHWHLEGRDLRGLGLRCGLPLEPAQQVCLKRFRAHRMYSSPTVSRFFPGNRGMDISVPELT